MAVYELLHGNPIKLETVVTGQDQTTPEDPTDIRLRVKLPQGAGYLNSPSELSLEFEAAEGRAWCIFIPQYEGVYAYRWWFDEFPGGAVEGIFRVRPSTVASDD